MSWRDTIKAGLGKNNIRKQQFSRTGRPMQPETAGQVDERTDSIYGKVYNRGGKTFYEAGTNMHSMRLPTGYGAQNPVELTQDLINQIFSEQGYNGELSNSTMTQIVGSAGPSGQLIRFLQDKGIIRT